MLLAGKLALTFILFQGSSLNIGDAYLYLGVKSFPAEAADPGFEYSRLGQGCGLVEECQSGLYHEDGRGHISTL